jgi:hypothetical protein
MSSRSPASSGHRRRPAGALRRISLEVRIGGRAWAGEAEGHGDVLEVEALAVGSAARDSAGEEPENGAAALRPRLVWWLWP